MHHTAATQAAELQSDAATRPCEQPHPPNDLMGATRATGKRKGRPYPERLGSVRERRTLGRVYCLVDIAVALTVLVTILVLANSGHFAGGAEGFLATRVTVKNIILLDVFCAAWATSFAALGLYEPATLHGGGGGNTYRIVMACTMGTTAILLFPLATHNTGAFTYRDALWFWVAGGAATIIARRCVYLAHHAVRHRVAQRVIIVGTGPRAVELARQLRMAARTAYDILGFVDTRNAGVLDDRCHPRLGFLDELEQTIMQTVVDEVLIALPIKSHYAAIEDAIRACERAGVQSKYLVDVFDARLARSQLEVCGDFTLMAIRTVQDDYRLLIKRALDVLLVVASIPITIPLCVCVAIAIKLDSHGNVVFGQERYGHHKRRFRMYKFRTMIAEAETLQSHVERLNEASGPVFKINNDPRVTPIGRFLRRTSLDELPQLFNVLRGNVSLVGPRPLAVRDVRLFSEAWLMRRFSVQPGLTCLWQISGRSNLPFADWVRLDLDYIDNWSLRSDLKILAKTMPAVLKGTGAT